MSFVDSVRLSPPREYKKDEFGRALRYDRGAPIPFGAQSFRRIVDTLHFHKACLASGELAQVSRVIGPNNITCTSSKLHDTITTNQRSFLYRNPFLPHCMVQAFHLLQSRCLDNFGIPTQPIIL